VKNKPLHICLFTTVIFFTLLWTTCISEVKASSVQKGTGIARIINGNLNSARDTAIKSALFDASTRHKSRIFGYSHTEQGQLIDDSTVVYSNARIIDYKTIDEQIFDNVIQITVSVKFTESVKKIKCKKEKLIRNVFLNFPATSFSNLDRDEELYFEKLVNSSFQNFKLHIQKNFGNPSYRINFKNEVNSIPLNANLYDRLLYNIGNKPVENAISIGISFHIEKIDFNFKESYKLNYSVKVHNKNSTLGYGSIHFTKSVATPSRILNVLTNSALRFNTENIDFKKILNLQNILKPIKSKCLPLRAKLKYASGRHFVELGSANGINRNDLGWVEKNGADGELFLIDKIEKRKTFFRINKNLTKYINNYPIITMVRYD